MMTPDPQTPHLQRPDERPALPDVATSTVVGAGADELPAFITPSQVGKACRMSRRSAKTLLRGAGIAERDEGTGRWYVATERLRERLPDVYARVRVALARRPT